MEANDNIASAQLAVLISTYYAAKLKKMRIDKGDLAQMLPCQLQLPRLTNLQIGKVCNDEDLQKLFLLTAPLKELGIGGPNWYCGSPPINLSTLLNIFYGFPSLEKVEIQHCFVDTQVDVIYRVNFSVRKLTLNLRVKEGHGPTSFNFLQVFKTLEELDVTLESPKEAYLGRNEGEGELQFYKMMETGQLYESNIWALIPSLKTVDIEFGGDCMGAVEGSRKDFEAYQAIQLQE